MLRDKAVVIEPLISAKEAGLRYTTDTEPGIIRKASGKGFKYIGTQGQVIKDNKTKSRIKKLGIPPAWKHVWICKYENGHLQATGRDSRGRKQYRYHEKWREVRDETKYNRMIAFGHELPKIRRRTEKDLKQKGLPKTKVLATIVQLLEKTLIIVGNEEYAKTNNSYGLTTMRDKHVDINGKEVTFEFKGKSGVTHSISLEDPELAKIIKNCQDLPGYELFQYIDETGTRQSLSSSDVNSYIKKITNENYTAKDFRTWHGTVLAAEALRAYEKVDSDAMTKKNIVRAIESVSEQLGNTKAVCRKCYIHPEVIKSYIDGTLIDYYENELQNLITDDLSDLKPEEVAVIAFLKQRLEEKG